MSGGVLTLGNSNALQNSTLDYSSYGGSLNFGGLTAAVLGGLKGSQDLTLTNSSGGNVAVTVGGNDQSTTYSGNLSGGGSITKVGNGTLTLSNLNAYTGDTTVNQG